MEVNRRYRPARGASYRQSDQEHSVAIVYDTYQRDEAERLLPLLKVDDPQRVVAMHDGDAITAAQFLAHVQHIAAQLPDASAAVNLCEDRYAFMVAFLRYRLARAGQSAATVACAACRGRSDGRPSGLSCRW
jgi:hypothetical protein